MRSRMAALGVILAIALGGCLSAPAGPDATSPTTNATTSVETTTVACDARTPEYDVDRPEKPDELDETSAITLAKSYERSYRFTKIRTVYENVSFGSRWFRDPEVTPIDDGFEVRVNLQIDYSTDEQTASGGYPATYRITDRKFVREGRTLACWGSE